MRIVQFLTVVGILAAGACAAWPFRRPRPCTIEVAANAQPPLDLTLRQTEVPTDTAPSLAVSPAVGLETAPASFAPMSYRTEHQDRIVDLENLAPPPDLPLVFQPPGELAPLASSQNVPRPHTLPSAPLAPAPRVRAYRLRDGDTLEQLAERFLGSRERAAEIFEANRDVLAHPDLLPVGRTLTIPPREGAESRAGRR